MPTGYFFPVKWKISLLLKSECGHFLRRKESKGSKGFPFFPRLFVGLSFSHQVMTEPIATTTTCSTRVPYFAWKLFKGITTLL